MFNLNQLKSFYNNSPLWVQKLYSSIPYELRNGSEFRKWNHFLSKNVDIEEYKLLKMKETVYHAYENTIFYKRWYDSLGISPYDINEMSDFQNLPCIDKDIVRENFNEMTVRNYPSNKVFKVTTGGTSGTPMKFIQSSNVWKKELAFGFNYFSQYGYDPNMLKASFRGGDFSKLENDKYYLQNPIHNEIHFSPFHIMESTIQNYVELLNTYKPKFFHGYPSSILLLVEYMRKQNLQLDYDLKAIFLVSESYLLSDIKTIVSFFKCKISSFYGHTERLIFAPNYASDLSSYRIDDRYGLCELVDEKNKQINENSKYGELVGSSFDNLAMPLIRYKTNDFTSYIDYDENIISTVEGQRESNEYLLDNNGRKVYLTGITSHTDIFNNIVKYQYIQNILGEVKLLIITTKSFQDSDKASILRVLTQKTHQKIFFKIEIVKQLKLTSRGKIKSVIREIK